MTDWQSSNDIPGNEQPYIRVPPLHPNDSPSDPTLTLAVIGDVHDQWSQEDEQALQALGVDLVLLVGDFGNESVEVVRAIAALPLPKAVILGNHDAWYSASDWGRKRCPYDRTQEDRVQQQLDLLGPVHVGYGKLDLPQFNLTVIGSRPFSWGGPEWKNAEFYHARYGVSSFAESTERILQAVQAAAHKTLIFLGHSGPTGLGDQPESPCGRDWPPLGGDFGDPDLAAAIAAARQRGARIPLVTFGHMHHSLRHTKQRLRTPVVVDGSGTVYLNAARVPRIMQNQHRNLSLVTLVGSTVTQASLVWVDPTGAIAAAEVLYRASGEPFPQPTFSPA